MVGTIISGKMDKTVVVLVERLKEHPVYKKKYKANTKFLAENPRNEYKKGDLVEIIETRPLSARKHWTIERKIEIRNPDSSKRKKKTS